MRTSIEARMKIEDNLREELQAVKVGIVFISGNVWYYQVLLFVA